MSAMRKNEIETARGRTRNKYLPVRTPYPINMLQKMAIAIIRPHAAPGIRFHQANCVYPCEFSTSFMPETARAMIGVGWTAARAWTVDHNSACSWVVASLIIQNALIEIAPQQITHFGPISGWQQVGAHIFRADRIGLRFLVVLPLVVPADRHRKGESDQQSEHG